MSVEHFTNGKPKKPSADINNPKAFSDVKFMSSKIHTQTCHT